MTATAPARRLADGVHTQPLGMGCWGIGGPFENNGAPMGWSTAADEHSMTGLHRAIEAGATLFDTADVYGHGHSERLLGQVLGQYPREAFQISTKVGYVRGTAAHPYDAPQLAHQFDQSRENLGVEYVDLYFLHHLEFGPCDRYLGSAVEQVRALRESGAVRAIGMRGPHPLSSDSPADFQRRRTRFLDLFHLIEPDVLWIRFNPLTPDLHLGEEDIFDFTARHGVGLLLGEPLAHGLLTGKYDPAQPPGFGPGDHRSARRGFTADGIAAINEGLRPLRERFGEDPQSLARVALGYCLQRGPHTAVLSGFTHPDQVTANAAVLTDPLSCEDIAFAEAAYAQLRASLHNHGRLLLAGVPG